MAEGTGKRTHLPVRQKAVMGSPAMLYDFNRTKQIVNMFALIIRGEIGQTTLSIHGDRT